MGAKTLLTVEHLLPGFSARVEELFAV